MAIEEKNKEVIGYYTEDGNIYCVECINNNMDLMKAIDRAIAGEDSKENPYVCEGCKAEIKFQPIVSGETGLLDSLGGHYAECAESVADVGSQIQTVCSGEPG